MHKMLCVGEIVNTHGISGELKVVPLVDDMEIFKCFKELFINNTLYNINGVRFHKNFVLVKFEGINDKTNADKFKGKFLEIDRDNLKKPEQGRYYVCDIIGIEVIDEAIGNIGKIKDIIQTGSSNDVYVISYHGKDICIPAIESVIKEINIESGYMKIILPKGIIDDEIKG